MRSSLLLLLIAVSTTFAQKTQTDSLKKLAIGYADLGENEKAIRAFKVVSKLYLTQKNYEQFAYTNHQLAIIYTDEDKYDLTTQTLNEIINKAKNLSDTTKIKVFGEYFRAYKLATKKDLAQVYSKKIETIFNKNPSLVKHSVAYNYYRVSAYYANAEGDYEKARVYTDLLIEVRKDYPESSKSNLYNLKGLIYKNIKDYKQAMFFFEKAATVATKPQVKAYNFQLVAQCLHEQNIFLGADRYIKLAMQSRDLHQKQSKSIDNELNYYLIIAEARQAKLKKQLLLAEKKYLEALSLIRQNFKFAISAFEVTTYIDLSKLKIQQNNYKAAQNYAQDALKSANRAFKSDNLLENPIPQGAYFQLYLAKALLNKAQLFKNLFEKQNTPEYLKISNKAFLAAFESVTYLRKTYEEENSKIFLNDEVYPLYENALSVANQLINLEKNSSNIESLFKLKQFFESNILLDEIRESTIKPRFVDTETLKEEAKLNQEITETEILLAENPKNDTLKKTLNDKKIDLDFLRKKIKDKAPNFYEAKFKQNLVSINQIQAKLEDNDLVISYSLTRKNLSIISIQKKSVKHYSKVIDSTFQKHIILFRNILSNSPQGKKYNAQALSAEFYDVLIKPIEKEIEGKKRLIIIRDAELNYLPFEVLAKQRDDFLLKKYIISYAYSASLLLPVKREQKQGSGLLGFAPFANNSFQQSLFRDKNLGQLPKSGNEVEKIGGDIYLENEATKKRFYEKYRDKNIIHFATHAITDDNDPLKSFIAFYPDGTDYKLFTNELYDLDLRNTSLVMLSACETGAGKLQKGEGVMSLSRAFTYAGAKAVITTLWNAHDEASAYISERFYKHLKDGLKTDEALQKAKIDFLNSDLALRYEHPYYWANFILIGPTETIDFGTNWWVWGISIIILLFLIFMVTKFRGKSISPKQAETRIG